MAKIKDGYNGEPTNINFNCEVNSKLCEVWTEITGISGSVKETLHYATLHEIIDMRNELNTIIKKMVGVQND